MSEQSLTLFSCLSYKLCTSFINCFSVFIDNLEDIVVLGCNLKVTNITPNKTNKIKRLKKNLCMMEIIF